MLNLKKCILYKLNMTAPWPRLPSITGVPDSGLGRSMWGFTLEFSLFLCHKLHSILSSYSPNSFRSFNFIFSRASATSLVSRYPCIARTLVIGASSHLIPRSSRGPEFEILLLYLLIFTMFTTEMAFNYALHRPIFKNFFFPSQFL